MTFYVQVNEDNIITDIVDFAYGNYVPVEVTGELLIGLHAGYYRLLDGKFVKDDELFDKIQAETNDELNKNV